MESCPARISISTWTPTMPRHTIVYKTYLIYFYWNILKLIRTSFVWFQSSADGGLMPGCTCEGLASVRMVGKSHGNYSFLLPNAGIL